MNSLNIIELVEKSDKAYALAMVPSDVLKKYTEAIVRECMSVADFPKNLTGQWDHLESSEVIAAHFGLDK
jgi:hypothetical protein